MFTSKSSQDCRPELFEPGAKKYVFSVSELSVFTDTLIWEKLNSPLITEHSSKHFEIRILLFHTTEILAYILRVLK